MIISTSNYALKVPALLSCLCTTIFLCSLFSISTDLRMPLVSRGLFYSFFCLFDTFWRGAQKFINFSTFWDTVQRINWHHCDLKPALLSSQHFLIENLLCFLIFSISWKTQNISSKLSNSSELCWFPIIKNWAWWYDKVLTRFPETTEELSLLVNILSIRVAELC